MKLALILSIKFSMLYVSAFALPYIEDSDFFVQEYLKSVNQQTAIHFIEEDMLILEKEDNIRLVRNVVLEPDPIFSVNVSSQIERGFLGITSINSTVFLYYTEAEFPQGTPVGNMIYQYDGNGKELINEVLFYDLPVNAVTPIHNGEQW